MKSLYTPVQRAQRRMNKAKPNRQMKALRAKTSPTVSRIPTMSEMIKLQAHSLKRAGRMKY